jgi:ribosome recycling factor
MEELDLLLEEAKDLMQKAYVHVGSELTKIRAGKANPSMVDSVQVSYYGTMSPLNQVASVTAP